jgi:hypothetical protein
MTRPSTPGTPAPGDSARNDPAPARTLPGKVPSGGAARVSGTPGGAVRGSGTHGRSGGAARGASTHGRSGARAPVDLLTVTPERVQRALWRSFLRCGFTGELDDAVHAAMNVITPVLAARDTEITRLREALGRAGAPAGRTEGAVAVSRRLAARRDPLLGAEQAS